MQQFIHPDHEYKTVVYRKWNSRAVWCSLTDFSEDEETQAQEFFWQTHGKHIQAALAEWQAQGWEPMSDLGSQAIRLRKTISLATNVEPSDIFLWFLTLGIALIFQVLLGGFARRYVSYKPLELRIQMVRVRERSLATA